ncbi:SpoIIE family protein phosphatase [Aggregicoccus sp. 17bor-14]|uniref:ATP-binding SpoIIE family protein phosphatase n=1 Tax=Myxococcaceae TaxID=31 RepID=UPI00129CA1EF|nr:MULTISPECIES: ATP-binding SpoIIE family protein phosphatase [Myxococcaceae]MBF5045517.1 SpoIIE family protein phosphatase [Simulacricoccus sp. 17bor-14]MRI91254.1 SpoIIE family protein phosphatase [Aggregicoccus sp. 17bor-14]
MLHSQAITVRESSQVGEARRGAVLIAAGLGMNAELQARAGLIATEAATNLLRHGGGGEVLLRAVETGSQAGVELLALDRGSGIADVARSLRDGYSTAGTAGEGLGAIQRQSTVFDLYAPMGQGTALLSQLWAEGGEPSDRPVVVGAVCVAKPGESACGDAWWVECHPEGATVLVADGLGHGPQAATASLEAVRLLRAQPRLAPGEQLRRLHAGLHATRGCAAAVAAVDVRAGVLQYSGVGNITGTVLLEAQRTHLVSHNGTLGHDTPLVQELPYVYPEGALLVMASDGLGTQWRPERYPGLLARHPSLVAGVLYRDFARGRDDVTVVAVRGGRG